MLPADVSPILVLPAVGAVTLLVLLGYIASLYLRGRLARRAGAFDRAIDIERRLAAVVRWRSFSGPRLADLYLEAGRKDDEALALYEASFAEMPDPKVAAGRIASLLRLEDLDRSFDLCRLVFERLYEENVRTPLVWEMTSEIALRLGREERAVALLLEWMDELPNPQTGLRLRDLFLRSGERSDRAEEALRRSLAYEPDHRPAIERLYDMLADRWDTADDSLFLYRKALALDDSLEWAHAAVAEILGRQGLSEEILPHLVKSRQFDKALQAVLDIYGPHPDEPAALRAMCGVVMGQERTDPHALHICHRYLATGEDDGAVLDYLFRVLSDLRSRTPEALAFFETYRRTRPDDREGLRALAKAYRDTGRVRDAVWLFDEGLEEFPDDACLLRDRAVTFQRESMRSEKAVAGMRAYLAVEWDEEVGAFLRKVLLEGGAPRRDVVEGLGLWLDRHPDDEEALRALARLHLEDDDPAAGVPVFRRLVELGHEQPWVVRGLAGLLSQAGDRSPEAEAVYVRAVNQGVAGDDVIVALAEMALAQGREDGFALEMFRRAANVPDCPSEVRVGLAALYFGMGMYDITASLARETLEKDPGHLEAQRWLGKALTRSGADATAYARLEKVYAERPDDPALLAELTEAYAAAEVANSHALSVYARFLEKREAGRRGEADPLTLAVWKLYGLATFRAGDYATGFRALKVLYEESPDHARSLVTGAEKLLEAPRERERLIAMMLAYGDVSPAHPLLVAHARKRPERIDLLVGFLRKTRRDFVEALGQVMEVLEELHEADLVTVRLLGELASCHVFAGDLDMAARRWRDLLDLTHDEAREGPPLPGARHEPRRPLGRTDVSRLLGRVLKLLKKGVRHASVYLVAGRLLLRKANPRKAAIYFEKARRLSPGDREAARFGILAYRQCLAETPSHAVRERLADLLADEELWDEAIVEYQALPAEQDASRRVAVKLARCFLEKGHPGVAAVEIEKALEGEEVTDDNLEAWYTLGLAFERAGRRGRARETFERVGFADFSYRDVRTRLEALSAEEAGAEAPPSDPRVTIGDLATGEFDLSEVRHERFEILEPLGRGGMASVYKALDHEFDPPLAVALKILPEAVSQSEKAVRLFRREAAATVRLQHPNIVRVYSTGEEGGRRYISMELIDGPDLASVIDRTGRIEPRQVTAWLRQLLAGLGYAHDQGVFHKDVKPANILLTRLGPDGVVKITDFGIARMVSEERSRTQTLSIRGTLAYMSPQQIRGEPAAASDDLYSLGITLYEMLSGDPPFVRGDIAYQQAHKAPRPLGEVAPGVPPFLEDIVMTCLAKSAGQRFASAAEIVRRLS